MDCHRACCLASALLVLVLSSGCAAQGKRALLPPDLLPANAALAEIAPGLGANHSTPDGHYLWAQGFKHSGSFEEVIKLIDQKASALGYRLENHSNYVKNFGDTGIPNREIMRIWRSGKDSFSLFYFRRMTSHYTPEYADFALTARDY
jgi:hypothetical protein